MHRLGLNFSILLLFHVKIADEKNKTCSYSSLLLATVDLKFLGSNLSPKFAATLGVLAIQTSVISGYDIA